MHHIQSLAREADYERYVCSLCAKAEQRSHVWAVLALIHELLKIPASVSEEMVGMIRIKWWQEQLTWHIMKDSRSRLDHPILHALEHVALPLSVIDALCEFLMAQCSGTATTLTEAQHTLGLCYELLAYAANEDAQRDAYYILGEQAAVIATIRMNGLKSNSSASEAMLHHIGQNSLKGAELRGVPFLSALHTHNALWKKQLAIYEKTKQPHTLKHIPFFALKLGLHRLGI